MSLLEKGTLVSELYRFGREDLAKQILDKDFIEPCFSADLEDKRASYFLRNMLYTPEFEELIENIILYHNTESSNAKQKNIKSIVNDLHKNLNTSNNIYNKISHFYSTKKYNQNKNQNVPAQPKSTSYYEVDYDSDDGFFEKPRTLTKKSKAWISLF